MAEVIVLNNSFMPIGRTTLERAVCLIFLEKAYSIKDSDKVLRSAKLTVPCPCVIVISNSRYIASNKIGWSRKKVLERDGWKCVKCGNDDRRQLSLEHLTPRNRWDQISKERNYQYSLNSYENCVCLCKTCNSSKSNRLPEEIGWDYTPIKMLPDILLDWNAIFELEGITK